VNRHEKQQKNKVKLAVLLLVAIVVSVCRISAHYVPSFVHDHEGNLVWPTPGYTFLLWPTTSTGLIIQVIEP